MKTAARAQHPGCLLAFLTVWGTLFAAGGIGLLSGVVPPLLLHRESASWVVVPATVQDVQLDTVRTGR